MGIIEMLVILGVFCFMFYMVGAIAYHAGEGASIDRQLRRMAIDRRDPPPTHGIKVTGGVITGSRHASVVHAAQNNEPLMRQVRDSYKIADDKERELTLYLAALLDAAQPWMDGWEPSFRTRVHDALGEFELLYGANIPRYYEIRPDEDNPTGGTRWHLITR